jgi:hypothetical protein
MQRSLFGSIPRIFRNEQDEGDGQTGGASVLASRKAPFHFQKSLYMKPGQGCIRGVRK